MKFPLQLVVYLVLNFGALGIGSLFMGGAVSGDWYQTLDKAPWTPPGWVFGAAWFTVMLTFSVFMALMTEKKSFWNLGSPIVALFWMQWILNILWNLIFFNLHWVGFGLIEIVMLFVIVIGLFIIGLRNKGLKSLWIAPYLIWLSIAISLNGYIYFMN